MEEKKPIQTNIIKTIDNMGRILIAKSLRKKLEISEGTELMFSEENGQLVIEKKQENCLYDTVLDPVSRIVIPCEIRKRLNMEIGTELEFFTDDKRLILKVKGQKCIFCEGDDKLFYYFSKPVCEKCINEIKKMAE